MDLATLSNLISKGMGVGAKKYGTPYDVYRPRSATGPIESRNKTIELFAAFEKIGRSGIIRRPELRVGVFDFCYTQAGDYLVGLTETLFIGLQLPGSPIQCVVTNCSVTLRRPAPPLEGSYSGYTPNGSAVVIENWPGSLVEENDGPVSPLAGERGQSGWTLLLPPMPFRPLIGDVVTEASNAVYLVGAVEENTQGWRLSLKQVHA